MKLPGVSLRKCYYRNGGGECQFAAVIELVGSYFRCDEEPDELAELRAIESLINQARDLIAAWEAQGGK